MNAISLIAVRCASVLLATFLGGFFIAHASVADVSFTINGEETATAAVGEDLEFAVTILSGEDFIEAAEILVEKDGEEISGFSSTSCGEGQDFSTEDFIDCLWDPPLEESDLVSFQLDALEAGEYTLVVSVLPPADDTGAFPFAFFGPSPPGGSSEEDEWEVHEFEFTVEAESEPVESTPISIKVVSLSTNATSTQAVHPGDTITLSFLLSEIATTANVSILNTSVEVATNTATHTVTHTVSEDDPAGEVTFSIFVEDAAGNQITTTNTTDGTELTIAEQEEEPETIAYNIALVEGFNLISLPVQPNDTDIATVLDSILDDVNSVWTYIDGAWQVYDPSNENLSNLTTMVAGRGYFVDIKKDTELTGEGLIGTTRVLTNGWNLIGPLQKAEEIDEGFSIDTAFHSVGLAGVAYTHLLSYDPEEKRLIVPEVVLPGQGFWMYVGESSATLAASAT